MSPSGSPVVPGYELGRLLARGSNEALYEASKLGPEGFRRQVVLKILVAEDVTPALKKAFAEHARTLALLDHPNVLPVLDLLVVEGRPVIVAELLRGSDLASLLGGGRRPLPPWVVASVADQALDGLGYGHRFESAGRPLVHGDVSARNVFVCESGLVKLLDFGVASLRPVKLPTASPQQLRGAAIDARSDLWQLGALMFEALAGLPPGAKSKHLEALSDATPALARVVERALASDPADGWPDAAAMRTALAPILRRMHDRGPEALARWLAAPDAPGETRQLHETASARGPGRRRPRRRPDRPGELPERFEVAHVLGRGGMGEVVCAHDRVLGRDVAVKRLRAERWLDASMRERFLREARAAAALRHPAIVAVYDMDPDGAWVVMELVRGETLRERVRREGRLPAEEVRRIARALLGALAVAHAAGIVHRDVTPGNVMIDEHAQWRLSDFGIAHLVGSELTHTGLQIGTPAYMPPEQLRGLAVDARSDVYAAGATLFEAATGSRLHGPDGHAPDPERAVVDATADVALGRAIARSVRERPTDRFPSVEDMLRALER